jgi:hypothetical protein
MPHAIQQLNDRTLHITVIGEFGRADQAAMQDAARALIATAGRISILIVLQDFSGFERGADWGDMDFYARHADDIVRMAIVGDPKWKDNAEAFTGAGMRATKIEFFAPAALAQAKAWIVSA